MKFEKNQVNDLRLDLTWLGERKTWLGLTWNFAPWLDDLTLTCHQKHFFANDLTWLDLSPFDEWLDLTGVEKNATCPSLGECSLNCKKNLRKPSQMREYVS